MLPVGTRVLYVTTDRHEFKLYTVRSNSLQDYTMDTFERMLTIHGGDQVYGPDQTGILRRVFERVCADQEVADGEARENMARIVLMANYANVSENELYNLACKVVKRFPQS